MQAPILAGLTAFFVEHSTAVSWTAGEIYSPFCALREEIRAKGEIRAQVSTAAGAAWTAAFAGMIDPETKTRISDTDAGGEHRVRQ